MPRLAEVQESFARAGCFVLERFTPARDGALAFSRRVVRLRLGLAFGRQLIVLCRRNAKSFAGGPHARAIAVDVSASLFLRRDMSTVLRVT